MKRNKGDILKYAFLDCLLTNIPIFGAIFCFFQYENNKINKLYLFSFAICIIIWVLAKYACYYTRKNDEVNSELEAYLQRRINNEPQKEKKDILALMKDNTQEIKEYFEISKKQEKTSYWISISCAVLGIVMLICSIIALFMSEDKEITAITIVGGAITEFVSGVVLWIHNKSAMQLNYYYDALHENETFLSAINLADSLEKENKEQMYMEIIKRQVSGKSLKNKENRDIEE